MSTDSGEVRGESIEGFPQSIVIAGPAIEGLDPSRLQEVATRAGALLAEEIGQGVDVSTSLRILTSKDWKAVEQMSHLKGLADYLRRSRDEQGLSQYDVARKMGVSQSNVSDIESSTVIPRIPTLMRFAGALGQRVELVLVNPELEVNPVVAGPVNSPETTADRPVIIGDLSRLTPELADALNVLLRGHGLLIRLPGHENQRNKDGLAGS